MRLTAQLKKEKKKWCEVYVMKKKKRVLAFNSERLFEFWSEVTLERVAERESRREVRLTAQLRKQNI